MKKVFLVQELVFESMSDMLLVYNVPYCNLQYRYKYGDWFVKFGSASVVPESSLISKRGEAVSPLRNFPADVDSIVSVHSYPNRACQNKKNCPFSVIRRRTEGEIRILK